MSEHQSEEFQKLTEFSERLNVSKDKSQNVDDYKGILKMSKKSKKAMQLASQLIPLYVKFFPTLSNEAFNAHIDCIDYGELETRLQAIRGLPLFYCKDTPDTISKIVEVLVQLLDSVQTVDRRTAHEALMSLIRQDPKASLTTLLSHGGEGVQTLNFISDELPEETKLDLLKALADISPYPTALEARQMLPSIAQLLKKYMPARKTGEEMNFTYVECLLYAFHHLAHKVPNATNSLCGYKIFTGQPSDRLGKDFSELNKDFTARLTTVEDLTKTTMKKLTEEMTERKKAMSAAKTDEEKKTKEQNTTTGLRTCNNILAMTKPLHVKVPSFIGDTNINLSWKEATKPLPSATTTIGGKRPANSNTGSGNNVSAKRGRGSSGMSNQLVNKAFQGISSHGGGRGGNRRRGGGRGRGQGRGHW